MNADLLTKFQNKAYAALKAYKHLIHPDNIDNTTQEQREQAWQVYLSASDMSSRFTVAAEQENK